MNNILEKSIESAGGVNALAAALGVRQNTISNWRNRGIPRPWALLLEARYAVTNNTRQPEKATA